MLWFADGIALVEGELVARLEEDEVRAGCLAPGGSGLENFSFAMWSASTVDHVLILYVWYISHDT